MPVINVKAAVVLDAFHAASTYSRGRDEVDDVHITEILHRGEEGAYDEAVRMLNVRRPTRPLQGRALASCRLESASRNNRDGFTLAVEVRTHRSSPLRCGRVGRLATPTAVAMNSASNASRSTWLSPTARWVSR